MANKPKKGDVGTIIELDMQEDVSSAEAHSEEGTSGIVFIVTKPSGGSEKWVGVSVYGTNYLRYTVSADELDEASADYNDTPYLITPKFKLGSWEGHGDTAKMYVYDTEQPPG